MIFRIIGFGFFFFLISCNDGGVNTPGTMTASDSGKQLVTLYCGSCHQAVQPSDLDEMSWLNNVLPAMAPRLGIKVWSGNQYFPGEKPLISFADWTRLVEYFQREAPDTLTLPEQAEPVISSWLFSVEKPVYTSQSAATTLMVAADTTTKLIYSADDYGDLRAWTGQLKQSGVSRLPSPAVQMVKADSDAIFTLIGTMKAVDNPKGEVIALRPGAERIFRLADGPAAPTIGAGLPRPVFSACADFNRDGRRDWLVCGFGHEKGGLYLFTQTTEGSYAKSALRNVPGATQIQTGDFNGDGWTDFLCLFAHADEGIWLFINDGKGGFQQKNILHFPPQYGSTGFQLVDFNRDGLPDILYTCGDNSDYSRVLKPFHGIYIFINKGDWKFNRSWFYHVNGCTKAVAADFDGDGRQDIAGIAFFADLKNRPAEKFLLFRQDSLMKFSAQSPPIQKLGRWIAMEVVDADRDGDQDILLGNYSKGFINQSGVLKDWDQNSPFILLRNKRLRNTY